MQFIYHKDKEKNLYFRNLIDDFLYSYEVEYLDKKIATLHLVSKEEKVVTASQKLHIGWCKIDFKNIEKVIASLNEIGVDKITFIEREYSQRKIAINFDKLYKLLQNSSSQSGRSDMITIEYSKSLDDFLKSYPDSYMFNFSKQSIDEKKNDIKTIVLGCEGGFSKKELSQFSEDKIVGIDSDIILRSETAITVIASKIII